MSGDTPKRAPGSGSLTAVVVITVVVVIFAAVIAFSMYSSGMYGT
jgi:hypothetical protein